MLTNVRTFGVYVSDPERAVQFYTDQLGFEVRRSLPMGPQGNWIEVAPPGAQSRIVLYPRALMPDWESRKPSIVWGCEDIEATYRHLQARGVQFTKEPTPMPWGKFAMFVDPDGNEYGLAEGT